MGMPGPLPRGWPWQKGGSLDLTAADAGTSATARGSRTSCTYHYYCYYYDYYYYYYYYYYCCCCCYYFYYDYYYYYYYCLLYTSPSPRDS